MSILVKVILNIEGEKRVDVLSSEDERQNIVFDDLPFKDGMGNKKRK